MIDILIPVLGRPERVQPLVDNIHRQTWHPHRITFLCTEEDIKEVRECMVTDAAWVLRDQKGGAHEYPRKINAGYRWTGMASAEHYPWIFNAADDLEFTGDWDQLALQHATDDIHVIATNDRANSQVKKGAFGTHCLIRRTYIDTVGGSLDGPGTVFSEAYDHNFVDRELCHLAQHRGVFAYAKNSVVKHHHPLHDSKVQMDATYRKGLASFHDDQLLFFQRAHQWGWEGLSPQERRVARNRIMKP